MKYLIFIYLLASCSFIFGQSKKTISNDTLYIYFKYKKHEIKKGPRLLSSPNLMSTEYYFWFNKALDQHYIFLFNSHRKKDKKLIEIPVLKKKKSFLRKNKIYKYCDFKKMSLKEIEKFYWDNHNRIVYLIDRKEIKNGKILLKRVRFGSGYMHTK